jgi:hypothetical protein
MAPCSGLIVIAILIIRDVAFKNNYNECSRDSREMDGTTSSGSDIPDRDMSLATIDTSSNRASPLAALASEHLLAGNIGYRRQTTDHVRSTSSLQSGNAGQYSDVSIRSSVEEKSFS